MLAVTVTFRIPPDRAAEFLAAVRANARASLDREPGCRAFDVCADPERPGEVFLYEIYDDRAAFDAHLESEHFRAFDGATASMVDAKEIRLWPEVTR